MSDPAPRDTKPSCSPTDPPTSSSAPTPTPAPPAYTSENPNLTPGPATSSSWNSSPYAFAPNTNVLDAQGMPSDKAAAAREKAAAVMQALRSGEPGAVDKVMGDNQGKSAARGITPLSWGLDKVGEWRRRHSEKNEKKVEGS